MDKLCQGKDCRNLGMFQCQWCKNWFCLLHIIDENEDKQHGEEPALSCIECVPWNEFSGIDSSEVSEDPW